MLSTMEHEDVTQFLSRPPQEIEGIPAELMSALYKDLYCIAINQLRPHAVSSTLGPTALVNETYIKLFEKSKGAWQSREHFFNVAAKAMRQIIVDFVRMKLAQKRGGDAVTEPLDELEHLAYQDMASISQIEDALEELETKHPDLAQIVELRFFAGFTAEEAAAIMHCSRKTVHRKWEQAKQLLAQHLA